MDVTARVAIRRGETIAPGNAKVVQLVLDKAIGALHGDRFILRDQSATRTLGGGIIVDPFSPVSRRRSAARAAELAALEADSPEAALAGLSCASPAGIDLGRFERTYNLTTECAASLYAAAKVIAVGKEPRTGITTAYGTNCAQGPPMIGTFHRQHAGCGLKSRHCWRTRAQLPKRYFLALSARTRR